MNHSIDERGEKNYCTMRSHTKISPNVNNENKHLTDGRRYNTENIYSFIHSRSGLCKSAFNFCDSIQLHQILLQNSQIMRLSTISLVLLSKSNRLKFWRIYKAKYRNESTTDVQNSIAQWLFLRADVRRHIIFPPTFFLLLVFVVYFYFLLRMVFANAQMCARLCDRCDSVGVCARFWRFAICQMGTCFIVSWITNQRTKNYVAM